MEDIHYPDYEREMYLSPEELAAEQEALKLLPVFGRAETGARLIMETVEREAVLDECNEAKALYPAEKVGEPGEAPLLYTCGLCGRIHPHIISSGHAGTTIRYFPHCAMEGDDVDGYLALVRKWARDDN